METNQQPSLTKTRVFAVIVILASGVMGYYFIWQPLEAARRTGELHYYVKGLLLPPTFLYMGVVMLFADLRDGQIKTVGADGKKRLTSKGWSFVVGLVAVLGLVMIGWYVYLRSIGFSAF